MNLADIRNLVLQAAQRHHLDPGWFNAMIGAESAYHPGATSPRGAMGLGQLMPGTAREMGVRNPYDPAQNVEGAAGYLEKLQAMFAGDRTKATAAYNWGPGNVQRQGLAAMPAETRNYVARIGAQSGQPLDLSVPPLSAALTPQQPMAPAAPAPMVNTPEELTAGQPPAAAPSNKLSSLIADVQRAVPGATAEPAPSNPAGWAANLTLDYIGKAYQGKVWPPEVFERYKQLTTPGLMQPTTPPAPRRPPTSDLIS